jgi:[protein-PII] uridylyltransferase
LLESLFHSTRALLGTEPQESNTVLKQRTDEATRLTNLAGISEENRERFWAQLDVAYFLRHDASDIAWHTRHLNYQSQAEHVIVKARPTDGAEGLEVMVYTKDMPDLFARICLFFGSKAMNILDAKIHTTRRGYALDSFVVMPANESQELRTLAPMVEYELALQLQDPSQEAPKAQNIMDTRTSRLSRAFPVPPLVQIYPDEGSENWRLEITATDRRGLLSSIAESFVHFGITVQTAKVMTLGDRVEDVFVISGDCLQQPRTQRQFERSLLEALSETLKNVA